MYNPCMKRVFLLIVSSLLLFPLPAAVSPVSSLIGTVAVDIKEGSMEEVVYSAVREEYTDSWLGSYALSPLEFALAYSDELSGILPLDNFLLSSASGNEIKVQDRRTGMVLTFILKEGKIEAMSFQK